MIAVKKILLKIKLFCNKKLIKVLFLIIALQ